MLTSVVKVREKKRVSAKAAGTKPTGAQVPPTPSQLEGVGTVKTGSPDSPMKGKENMKSFKAQVIADNSGKWVNNALRFATRKEAEDYVVDLAWRWTLVRETRVVESDDPVNYVFKDGVTMRIEE